MLKARLCLLSPAALVIFVADFGYAASQSLLAARPRTLQESQTEWPACPAKGCNPCPEFSENRPNCTCMSGYTITGTLSGEREIPWDDMMGWSEKCLPISCGLPPPLSRARMIDAKEELLNVFFPEHVKYYCDAGYTVAGYDVIEKRLNGSVETVLGPVDAARLLERHCQADGSFSNTSDYLCVPECGDSRLVTVAHLPLYFPGEHCDDGNRESGDGCGADCLSELGWVCNGGGESSPDGCWKAEVYVDSALTLRISGNRSVDETELAHASQVAVGLTLGTPWRDVQVTSAEMVESEIPDGPAGSLTTNLQRLRFEGFVKFNVMFSDLQRLDVDRTMGALRTKGVFKPKLWNAFSDATSLHDVYVEIVGLQDPKINGDAEAGRIIVLTWRQLMLFWLEQLGPGLGYFTFVAVIVPMLYWYFKIRKREYRLMGRFEDISPEFKKDWAFGLCTWLQHKPLCCALVFLLPTRMADTWDAMGLVSFWAGMRRALCCIFLYLIGLGCCGALIPGQLRSEMRDFFDMGDGVKGNIELVDCCCWLLCPICCVIQEAAHVDQALKILPPPLQNRMAEFDDGYAYSADPEAAEEGKGIQLELDDGH